MRKKESKILYPGLEREVKKGDYVLDTDGKVYFLKSALTICSKGNRPDENWTSVEKGLYLF